MAVLVANRLKEEGFEGYEKPSKLHKVKNHLNNAEYVAMLNDDSLVITDKVSRRLQVFGADGSFQKTLVRNLKVLGVATNRSNMVTFVENKQGRDKFIHVLAAGSGQMFAKWGEDMEWAPRAVAMSNKGQLVITDMHKKHHQVGIYTVDGRCINQFGATGPRDEQVGDPLYATVDPFDRILVSDYSGHCVKVYDDRGTFLAKMGKQGREDGELVSPRGLCTDSKGNVFVCDAGNNRISVFSADGKFLQHLLTSEDGLVCPRAIALNRNSGHLVVTQHSSNAPDAFRKVRVYEIQRL